MKFLPIQRFLPVINYLWLPVINLVGFLLEEIYHKVPKKFKEIY